MSENLYSWHNEIMTNLEMREIEREIEQIRLIKDAGLATPGLFERIGMSLGNALVKRGQTLHEQRVSPRQAYQNTSCKMPHEQSFFLSDQGFHEPQGKP